MSKKFKLEVSDAELIELMTLLPKNPKKHKSLRSKIAPAFLESVSDKNFTPFIAKLVPGSDPLMQVLVSSLATITGFDESDITPVKKLNTDLGMTSIKFAQLTVALNNYLNTVAGSTAIGPTELAAKSTVQDVYDLLQSKTP